MASKGKIEEIVEDTPTSSVASSSTQPDPNALKNALNLTRPCRSEECWLITVNKNVAGVVRSEQEADELCAALAEKQSRDENVKDAQVVQLKNGRYVLGLVTKQNPAGETVESADIMEFAYSKNTFIIFQGPYDK
jgi:hypothetical protein